MEAISALSSSSPFMVGTTAAAVVAVAASQSKNFLRCHGLNSLSLIRCQDRSPLRLAAARNQVLRVSGDGGGGGGSSSSTVRGTIGERFCSTREKKRRSFAVVRAAGVTAEDGVAATAGISSDELKRKGDSYFLTDTRPVILFDGVCNMCNGGVNFMLDNDSEGKIRFAALQSEAGAALLVRSGRSPDDISSIVLVCKDGSYIKSEAILRLGQHLSFPYTSAAFVAFIIPLFLRDTLYDTVANNRYSVFGKTDACRLSDHRFAERFIE